MANQVSTESQGFSNLVDSSKPCISLVETLLTGYNLLAGTVMALSVSTGSGANKMVPYNSAEGNGENVPFGILANDTDSTGGDVQATVYTFGVFNENDLIFYNTDDTPTTAKTDMFGRGLFYYEFG